MTGPPVPVVGEDEFAARVIPPSAFVADTEAFVDVRLPRSAGKASYSFIGPGVSQNAGQTINLTVPHGFNVGAATVPSGKINNPHLHYTAEVFLCTAGKWRMMIGQHGEQTIDIAEGTIFSAPTHVFRGFQNIGDDDGWLFAVLGGDDTGGIVWAPQILKEAAATGLYLDRSNAVVEVEGAEPPADVIRPLSADEIHVERYDDDELRALSIEFDGLDWHDRALLSSVLDGHRVRLAPVIGYGMTEHRRHRPPIGHPHGFTVEWLEVAAGSSTGRHRHGQSQAVFLIEGQWEISVNEPGDELAATPEEGSIVSIPAGAWRSFANVGSGPARAVVVNGGDEPTRITWAPEIVAAAAEAGYALDRSGHLSRSSMLGPGA